VRFARASTGEIRASLRHVANQQTVGTTVMLSNRPYALAINGCGIMYAPRLDASSAARFDLPARDPTAHVSVGGTPTDVSFDRTGGRAFVSNQDGSVSVIDVASNTVSQTISVPGRAFVSLTSPNDDRLYVGSAIGKVYVYDFGSRRFTDSITVGDVPQHLTFNPDGIRLYVSMRDLGRVAEVDTRTNAVVRAFNSTYGIQEAVVAPDGSELYVANQSGWLEVWNLGTGTKTQQITLGDGPWALILSPDQSTLYAGILFSGEVAVIDRATRVVERYIDVGGIPRRIKFAPDNTTIVIANEAGYVTFIP
jgi:YVTN family beta-propeller protein